MEIKKYEVSKSHSAEFIKLLYEKYGSFKNFDYFLGDYQKAFDFCNINKNITFIPFAGYEGKKMKAHIALILDTRLPRQKAFFGFLEFPNNSLIFKSMWDSLVKEARQQEILSLDGPTNGSIWHQYRCIKETDGSEFFKSELFCESYYYNFLKAERPISEISYYSGYRKRFNAILDAGQSAYYKLAEAGFTIREMAPGSSEVLQTIASISRIVFKNSWGFTDLNLEEFLMLYSPEKTDTDIAKIYLLYNGDQIIGFCGTLKEDVSTLICKTIALLPKYHGSGLGNALAYKVHLDAQKQGIKKIIYALVREGNNIKNFPKEDAVILRKYAAFEFKI